jgi:hypothetical protein
MSRLLQAAMFTAALSASSLVLAQTTPPQPTQPEKAPSPSTAPPEKTAPPSAAPTPGTSATLPQWYAPQPGEVRASKLIGTSVKNAAGETIGDINEVVLGSDGKIAAVVIGVGGFLGMGEREVAVRFESLKLTRGSDQSTTATLNATKDSLQAAPEWKWSGEDSRTPSGKSTKPDQ